jgi:hypothetical protein
MLDGSSAARPCAAGGGRPPIIALPPIARPKRAYRALAAMGLDPLLHLGLRLGEGSGAAVAVPMVRAALAAHGEMATFEEAAVAGRL